MPKPLVPCSLLLLVSALAGGSAALSSPTSATPPKAAPAKSGKAAVAGAPDPALGQAMFSQAIADMQAGQYAEAESLFLHLTKLFPNVGAAWANLGILEARQNHLVQADVYLRKATALEPTSAAFWSQAAGVELRNRQPLPAEASARRALALDPANAYAVGDLAGALLQQGRFEEAIAPLRKLVALQGDTNPQASVSLMATLSRLGHFHDALPVAQKLAAHFPTQPEYQGFVGDLAVKLGDYATARTAYAHAYQLRPADARAGVNAAIASEASGDPHGAAAFISRVLTAHPDNAMANFEQGRLYYTYPDLGGNPPTNFVKAAASYRRAMLLDPKNPLYLRNLALALTFAGGDTNFDEAEKFFDAAIYVDPQDTVAHMGLGYLQEQRHHMDAAIAQYQAILAYAPNTYDTRRRLAGLLYATGKKDDAYQQFQALADQTPGAKGALPLKEVASLQMNDRRYEDARRSYAAAVARDPKDGSALVGEGQALEKLNRLADAEAAYRAAVAATPASATGYSALGELLLQQHRTPDAARVYEQFVAAVPTNNAARWQLASIYDGQNRVDDALRMLHTLTIERDDPTHLSYLLAPSSLLMRHGRSPEAVADLTALAETYPVTSGADGVEIRYALADAQQRVSRPADAEKTLTALVTAAGRDGAATARAETALAAVYQSESRWDDAGRAYEDVLKIDPSSAPARVGLVQATTHDNHPEEAGAYLETLALADPAAPNLTAATSVAMVYQEQQTPARYLDFASRVAAKYPNRHDALALYANALDQQSVNAAAGVKVGTTKMDANTRLQTLADLYRRMAALDPKDADARFRLGAVNEKLGNQPGAIAAYQDAVAAAGTTPNAAATSARESLRRLGVAVPAAPTGTAAVGSVAPGTTAGGAPTAAPAPPAAATAAGAPPPVGTAPTAPATVGALAPAGSAATP